MFGFHSNRLALAIAGFALMCAPACQKSSETTKAPVAISGRVDHAGTPVPKGRIEFEPDKKEGNSGSTVTIPIEGGLYSSPAGQGPLKGAHIIRIYGFDGVSQSNAPDGRPLFPVYSNTLDIPAGKLIFNFDVPTSK